MKTAQEWVERFRGGVTDAASFPDFIAAVQRDAIEAAVDVCRTKQAEYDQIRETFKAVAARWCAKEVADLKPKASECGSFANAADDDEAAWE